MSLIYRKIWHYLCIISLFSIIYIFLNTKGIRFVEGPYRESIKHRLCTVWFLHLKLNSVWMKERRETLYLKHEHGMLWGRAQVAHKHTERMTGGRKTWKERGTDAAICLSTRSERFITLIRFLQQPEHIHGLSQLPARSCLSHAVVSITSNMIIPRGGWQMWITSSVCAFMIREERESPEGQGQEESNE